MVKLGENKIKYLQENGGFCPGCLTPDNLRFCLGQKRKASILEEDCLAGTFLREITIQTIICTSCDTVWDEIRCGNDVIDII